MQYQNITVKYTFYVSRMYQLRVSFYDEGWIGVGRVVLGVRTHSPLLGDPQTS